MRSNGRTRIQEIALPRPTLYVRTSLQNLHSFLAFTGDIFTGYWGDTPVVQKLLAYEEASPQEQNALLYQEQHVGEGILRYCAENDDWE